MSTPSETGVQPRSGVAAIMVHGTRTGLVNLSCRDHPWWLRDQIRPSTLEALWEQAAVHLWEEHQ